MTKHNQTLLLMVLLAGAIASTGCKQKVPVESGDATPKPGVVDQDVAKAVDRDASDPAAEAKPLPNIAPPARIAEIEASGRTGFWSSVTEFCPGKTSRSTILTWNVSASGAKNVVVYVVDKQRNEERHFGRGGPIGERQSGPWLSPAGIQFKLRNADGGAELGDVVIERGASC